MLLFGIVLIALGAAAIVAANRRVAARHALIGASTSPVADLEVEREALVELGTVGGFRRVAAVVGYAHPPEDGPLRSPQTGTECVWYRRTVRRRTSEDGAWETVLEEASERPFVLVEETGNIGVDPRVTVPVQPEKVAGESSFGGHSYPTGAVVREEWVLRPGAGLYVHGEVHDRDGTLVIAAPETGTDPFVVSTRGSTDLRDDSLLLQRRWAWGGAASGVAGLALVVASLLG
ncbi:GIDE domain-containing protein [Actinomycetospora termitidis]|uniref:RING-type E3 ubiquitin transferase n=1 Tax=Actinomycetospora termitidis TaxID=3053470 RepID=A0ABT7M3L1_9PSEU|nr:GIDE domain-containing protein [Actinomycetospora sp. Odt1-22]MDL5155257.1 GIDE domain-containing protein [Actinomycetospora sp. Odt1-22]